MRSRWNCVRRFNLNQRNKSRFDQREFMRAATRIQEYRETNELPILPDWKKFRATWLDRKPGLFFIDLEFSTLQDDDCFYEICVADVDGKIILNTTIDHGYSIQGMYDRNSDAAHQGIIRKIYGAPSCEAPRGALTIGQVAEQLSEYFTPQCFLVEWSTNFCDYRHLFKALKSVGKEKIMPPVQNVFRPPFAWRLALQDFKISMRLSDIYRLLCHDNDTLSELAHRAEPDVRMMYKLVVLYFEGTLRPAHRTKITQYLIRAEHGVCARNTTGLSKPASILEKLGHYDIVPQHHEKSFRGLVEEAEDLKEQKFEEVRTRMSASPKNLTTRTWDWKLETQKWRTRTMS
jgi:hypothetical protein